MDATELQQRSGAVRLTWAESEHAILECCKRVANMTLASGMTGTPIDRDELRRQCEGLRRLLAEVDA